MVSLRMAFFGVRAAFVRSHGDMLGSRSPASSKCRGSCTLNQEYGHEAFCLRETLICKTAWFINGSVRVAVIPCRRRPAR